MCLSTLLKQQDDDNIICDIVENDLKFYYSKHALDRSLERELSQVMVYRAILYGGIYNYSTTEHCCAIVHENVCVVVNLKNRCIITVYNDFF